MVPEPKSKIRDHGLAASRFTQVERVKSIESAHDAGRQAHIIVGAVEIHRVAAFAGNARRAIDQRAVPAVHGGVGRRGAAGFVEQEQGL